MIFFLFFFHTFLAKCDLNQKEGVSNDIIRTAFQKYGSNLSIFFNGGKDSTVLLDLVLKESKKQQYPINIFYLETQNEFKEMREFLNFSENFWSMKLLKIKSDSLKKGLESVINEYGTKAVFLGVRMNDLPNNTKLNYFEKTTEGWPNVMRVMPLLDWNYTDIWEYIDLNELPVCSLYEKGYTSIGSINDTLPNPLLYDNETRKFKHARMLYDEAAERIGRYRT